MRKPATKKPAASKAAAKASPGVQGEGDYVSARKYNDRTRAFVARMAGGRVPAPPGDEPSRGELQSAERQALARSKGRAGDTADARVMKENVTAANARSRRRG